MSLIISADYADNFLVSISEDYSYISVTLQSVTEELLAEPYALLTVTVSIRNFVHSMLLNGLKTTDHFFRQRELRLRIRE